MNKKTIFRLTVALLVVGLFVGLAACGKKPPQRRGARARGGGKTDLASEPLATKDAPGDHDE